MDGTVLVQDTLINPPHPSKTGCWLHLGQRIEPVGKEIKAVLGGGNWHYFYQSDADSSVWISHHQCTPDEVARIMNALDDGVEFEEQIVSPTCTLLYRTIPKEE